VWVFDGTYMPAKKATESSRQSQRDACLERGLDLHAKGKRAAAAECFQKAVDVTPDMAHELIKALRAYKVDYIVAPYEADAQLAHLAMHGFVDAVVTEDSDLLVYGCPTVIFKLDPSGHGQRIHLKDLVRVKEYRFNGWTHDDFRHMCILSGCDYLASIPGMGLKRAYNCLRASTGRDCERAIALAKYKERLSVPADYVKAFWTAEWTFLYQRVYDPETRRLVHLHPLKQEHLDAMDAYGIQLDDFLGPTFDSETACKIARSEIHPMTLQPYPMTDRFRQTLVQHCTVTRRVVVDTEVVVDTATETTTETSIETTSTTSSTLERTSSGHLSINSKLEQTDLAPVTDSTEATAVTTPKRRRLPWASGPESSPLEQHVQSSVVKKRTSPTKSTLLFQTRSATTSRYFSTPQSQVVDLTDENQPTPTKPRRTSTYRSPQEAKRKGNAVLTMFYGES
jgi:exonuclease-1